MAFDGLILNSIVNELQILINGKVNRIFEPNNDEIILNIYSNGKTYNLNININANAYRINLTKNLKPNPYSAPNFCMLLRKYLINSKVSRIYTNGLERICFIDFECYNEMNDKIIRTLIVELMGRYSNIMLVNDKLYIIDALKRHDLQDLSDTSRSIMPARKYIYPKNDKIDFLSLNLNDFLEISLNKDIHVIDTLISNTFIGISKLFVQSTVDKLKISNTVNKENLKEVYEYIHKILEYKNTYCDNYKNSYSLFLYQGNDIAEHKKDDNYKEKNCLQINKFIDDFYYLKSCEELYKSYKNNILKIINLTLDKITKKIDNINAKIESCNDLDKYKIYGELLIANIYRINTLNITDNFVTLENYYDNNNLIKIPINNNLSTSQNAEKYFKKYSKLKNTLEIVNVQKKDALKELDYIESLIYAIGNADTYDALDNIYEEISESILFNDHIKNTNSKKSKEISSLDNYLRLNIDGYTVLVGKNNKQNDYLTTKLANDNDYWFHAKDIPGSHVILRNNGDMPKLDILEKCASLAAYYSKAKFSSNVPVDYTLIKYVKKPNSSVPGYVIYTNQKTLYVQPSSGL